MSIEKEFLNTKLEVINEDEKAFEFTAALHTHFGAKSITRYRRERIKRGEIYGFVRRRKRSAWKVRKRLGLIRKSIDLPKERSFGR